MSAASRSTLSTAFALKVKEIRGQLVNKDHGHLLVAEALEALSLYVAEVESTAIPFTVYTAKLDQPVPAASSGLLTIGKTYTIFELSGEDPGPDDFTNVGFVAVNTPFVASGTTPAQWTGGTLVFCVTDINAAFVESEVFENTIGTITLSFPGTDSKYRLTCTGAFLADKVFITINEDKVARVSDDALSIQPSESGGILTNFSVEVRVYN